MVGLHIYVRGKENSKWNKAKVLKYFDTSKKFKVSYGDDK
jgi:hypothetical protein